MEEYIDPSIFLKIGREMAYVDLQNDEVYHTENNKIEYIAELEKDVYAIQKHISDLEKKNNAISDKLRKTYSIFLFNKKSIEERNIEKQKNMYNNLTILKLKEDKQLLEDKIHKMKLLYIPNCI